MPRGCKPGIQTVCRRLSDCYILVNREVVALATVKEVVNTERDCTVQGG